MTIWEKGYIDLANTPRSGFYTACVRKHHWPDTYIFQAIPRSGGGCTEALCQDPDALVAKANQWLSGEMPEGFYGASL